MKRLSIRTGWIVGIAVLLGGVLAPPPAAEAYPCMKCEEIDFGWLNGSEVFCVIGESGDYLDCESNEHWCWTDRVCRILLV